MKAVYNQLRVLPDWRAGDHTHRDGSLHDMPEDNASKGGSGSSGGLGKGSKLRQSGRNKSSDDTRLSIDGLPFYDEAGIADLIPSYDDIELDYFGLAQQAGEYNLPQIDKNLSRAVDRAGPLAKRLTRSNTENYQSTMDALLPGNQGLINASTRRARQNLAGQLGPEVESAIFRSGAQRALSSGIGFGGRSGSLVARDLGLTSLDLQNTGFTQAQQMYNTSAGIAQQIMMRPSDLAMGLASQYNQASILTPEQAIAGETTNIESRFNISKLGIQNAQAAYTADYQRYSDRIAYQEAQDTREWQAKQAKKDRKYNLIGDVIGAAASIYGGKPPSPGGGNQTAAPAQWTPGPHRTGYQFPEPSINFSGYGNRSSGPTNTDPLSSLGTYSMTDYTAKASTPGPYRTGYQF